MFSSLVRVRVQFNRPGEVKSFIDNSTFLTGLAIRLSLMFHQKDGARDINITYL